MTYRYYDELDDAEPCPECRWRRDCLRCEVQKIVERRRETRKLGFILALVVAWVGSNLFAIAVKYGWFG